MLLVAGVVGLFAAGCGGGSKQKAGTTSASAAGSADSQATGICGSPAAPAQCLELGAADLPDAFGAWPEVVSAYRLGSRYDVLTSLSSDSYAKAVDLCDSVYGDISGGSTPNVPANQSPVIVVWSAGGPGEGVPLADGATAGSGCATDQSGS